MASRKMLTHGAKVYKTWHYLNEDIMKISIALTCLFFCGFMTVSPSLAQGIKTEGQSSASPSVEKIRQAGSEASKKETQQFAIRVKTKQKVDFSGTVTNIDPVAATLSVRSQGKTISFDMSRVILMGYGNTGEIKKGDMVSVGYTQFGLQIQKGAFAVTHRESASHQEVVTQKVIAKSETTKSRSQRGTPIRMKDNKYPTSFKDIDNNKDGKITPIELCVVVPDLTLQKFKEYDRNNDSCLNEQEFGTVKRTR